MKNKLLPIIALLFLFGACTQKSSEKKPFIVIDLAENIGETANDITLNDIFELERVIPLETSDSFLLSSFDFGTINDQELLIYDMRSVYCVNKESGKPRLILNKQGQGRGEYITVFDATLDNQENLLIFCARRNMLLKYSSNGDYIDNIHNDSIGYPIILNNDSYVVSHSPGSKSEYLMSVYDKSWNLVRQDFPRDNNIEYAGRHNFLRKINNECYFKPAFENDTIYHVTHQTTTPYMIIDKGQNIKSAYWMWTSNYMFIGYNHNDKAYYDIWNTKNDQLICRGIFDYYKREGTEGIPFLIDGVQIDVKISYASGDNVYCVVQAIEAMKFMPSIAEDDNPVILELKPKRNKLGV